jgi:4-hydroxybenzoate polyprenyltransferase
LTLSEIFFLTAGIILFFIIFFIIKNFRGFFYDSRPSRFIYYSVIFGCGFFLGIIKSGALSGISLWVNFLSGLFLINVLFLSSTILNNVYDKDIDRYNKKPNPLIGTISKKDYMKIYYICFFSSLLVSLSLNITSFFITLIILVTAFIYSCPPLRVKRFFPFNIILIGFSSVLALFLGFASSNEFKIIYDFPYRLGIAMLIVLSLAFNVKDINDYKGDKKYKIKTIMTLFGYKKGKIITALLAFSGYVLLPVLLDFKVMLFYSFIFGALTFIIIIKSKNVVNESVVFSVFFIYLFIFILHKPALF